MEIEIKQLELAALRLASGPLAVPQAEGALPVGAWSLAPLAAANGAIRAKIVDAQLLFDADVTVPINQGEVDFDDASVEHIGPDSRMGVGPQGIYVAAPNGRSYVYQFPATPVAGVEYERRGSLLPWVSDRGKLKLQAFAEGLLHQPPGVLGQGITEQTRQMLDRTSLAGELRLSDGKFAAPGLQAELFGRGEGCNELSLHSDAVGHGLTVAIAALSVRNVVLEAQGMRIRCDAVSGSLTLRILVDGTQARFALDIANLKISGLACAAGAPSAGAA